MFVFQINTQIPSKEASFPFLSERQIENEIDESKKKVGKSTRIKKGSLHSACHHRTVESSNNVSLHIHVHIGSINAICIRFIILSFVRCASKAITTFGYIYLHFITRQERTNWKKHWLGCCAVATQPEPFHNAIQTDAFVKEKLRSRLSFVFDKQKNEAKMKRRRNRYQRLFSECIFCQTRFYCISCIPKMIKLDVMCGWLSLDIGIYIMKSRVLCRCWCCFLCVFFFLLSFGIFI